MLIPLFCLLLHLFYGPGRTLASFRIYFQASLSLAVFSGLCYIHYLQIIFNTVKPPLSWLSNITSFFHSGTFLNTFFTDLSSGLLSSRPSRNNLPFLIFEVIFVSLHRSILFLVMTVCKVVSVSDTTVCLAYKQE